MVTIITLFPVSYTHLDVYKRQAFSYLAKRFGLNQLGIAGISPEQEPSPRQLTEIQEFVKTYKVKTIFTESNASSKVAETLVKMCIRDSLVYLQSSHANV